MHLRFGSTTTKQGLRTECKPADYTADELRALAGEAGVDPEGTKDVLAARLSAVETFEALPEPRVTYVHLPEDTTLGEAFTTLTAAKGRADVVLDVAGTWYYRWRSTGIGAAAEEGRFVVRTPLVVW